MDKVISLNLKNDQKNRLDPDAALATMPAKTQEVKKKEADDRAHWAESSRRIDKLRQHKLIGTSLDDFLKEYSGARLINSS